MSLTTRTLRSRITEVMNLMAMMSFMDTRKWETSGTLIAALWILATSGMERASFWKN